MPNDYQHTIIFSDIKPPLFLKNKNNPIKKACRLKYVVVLSELCSDSLHQSRNEEKLSSLLTWSVFFPAVFVFLAGWKLRKEHQTCWNHLPGHQGGSVCRQGGTFSFLYCADGFKNKTLIVISCTFPRFWWTCSTQMMSKHQLKQRSVQMLLVL